MIVVDTIVIVLLFVVFAIPHTWLASLKVKKTLADKLGNKIAFYRLFFNISSIIFFTVFYSVAPKPDVVVYDLRFPLDIITFAMQVFSLVGLVWATRQIILKEFAGIAQIERYIHGEYKIEDLDEKQTLKIDGAFKFVRHPVYLFTILFLGFRPTMSLFYFVMFICIVIYFYAGSIFEERKLLELFGDEYNEYKKKVPRIFPIKIKRNKK